METGRLGSCDGMEDTGIAGCDEFGFSCLRGPVWQRCRGCMTAMVAVVGRPIRVSGQSESRIGASLRGAAAWICRRRRGIE